MKKFIFSRWSFDHSLMGDTYRLKPVAAMVKILNRIKLIAGGNVSENFALQCSTIVKQLKEIQRSQGNKGLILYLKAAQIALQQAAAGYKIHDMRPLGARISRTRSLYPRIIPSTHRAILINNQPGKYILLKFYLTLFYMYRVIIVPQYKLNLQTIISSGAANVEQFIPVRYYMNFLRLILKGKWTLLYSPIGFMKSRPYSILKSSPNNVRGKGIEGDNINLWSTHPLVALKSLLGIINSPLYDDFLFLSNLYSPWILKFLTDIKSSKLGQIPGFSFLVGKLAFKEEPAGKVRVFAIVDCWTQWLLDPIHRLIFKVLRYIPMDGTFNQLKPIHRLLRLNMKEFYSLDLTAATDRLPLIIQSNLIGSWFTSIPGFGEAWARILVNRSYSYSCPKSINPNGYEQFGTVKYAVGQPMGALSSWAMLALTHHFLVQVAAWRCGFTSPTSLYKNYALLGDDLVICNKAVAESYLNLFKQIGVAINLSKSILSPYGKGLEFAKRTFVDGVDVSPISLKDLSLSLQPGNISQWVAFAKAHNLSLAQQANILGYGHKANKSSFRRLNHALKLIYLASIAKVDFNTQVLNLRYKVPVNLDIHVPAFIDQVIKPIIQDLEAGFQSDAWDDDPTGRGTHSIWEIDPQTRFEALYYTVTYTVSDWIKSHLPMFNELFLGIPLNGLPLSEAEADARVHMKSIQSYLTAYEGKRIILQLERAKNAINLQNLKTLDDCLVAYVNLTNLKAVQSIAIHKLADNITILPSVKLPFQARIFSAWSRITIRVAKVAHKVKQN